MIYALCTAVSKVSYWLTGIAPVPHGLDGVGYEGIIDFIKKNNILHVPGDFVEIGALFGGGTRKLSEFLKQDIGRKLYVIDVFDIETDKTVDALGRKIADNYRRVSEVYGGKSQWDIFCTLNGNAKNIVVLKTDSKLAVVPAASVAFAFIDGNHTPEYAENDFRLVWRKMSVGGILAMHDYKYDIPSLTNKIDDLVKVNSNEISKTFFDEKQHILYITKR